MWFYAILLLSFIVGSQCTGNSTDCLAKEKSLGVLELAKDTIEKVKDILPNCSDDHPSANSSECGKKEKALALLEIVTDLISEAEKNYPTCPYPESKPVILPTEKPEILTTEKPKIFTTEKPEILTTEKPVILLKEKPIDCNDRLQQGNKISGVYRVWPKYGLLNGTSVLVYCDMDTDGGGWTVIQRRGVNYKRQDFYQDWDTYKRGFGDLKGEFWLGNDNIYALTNQANYAVRIDLEDVEGARKYAVYDSFRIENEAALYKLHVTNYSGDAGNSMDYENGNVFCTKDKPNGKVVYGGTCAESRRTGWWFDACNRANINGLPGTGVPNDHKNLYWNEWKVYVSLASANMKLRRS